MPVKAGLLSTKAWLRGPFVRINQMVLGAIMIMAPDGITGTGLPNV